jgi:hypothetical protein
VERSQIQAFFITLLIICGLGFFVIPDSVWETIEVKEWLPDLSSSKKEETKSSGTIREKVTRKKSTHPDRKKVIDSYKGVEVYHNGSLSSVYGRHVSADGYNLGLKYQCVEFVKRFYYENYNHKMKQSYGHAKEFFDYGVSDGGFNNERGLFQYWNGSSYQPQKDAILVFNSDGSNSYGHVGIISDVRDGEIEMVSQNNGRNQKTRSVIPLLLVNGKYKIDSDYVLGWLSK